MPRLLRSDTLVAALAPAAFLVIAALLLWPLPLHLSTALPGDPTGDVGVYIWNLWIFRHEFLDHARLPLSTDHVFAYSGSADFSLHNYTPLAGMLGLPLMAVLGVVSTFNVVLMLVVGASGYATYVLAESLGLSRLASFAAGALFIATPVITAREVAHLSLVSAAALPLFIWALRRVLASAHRRDAVLVGVIVAVATYSDAYFGVYCVLMGLLLLGWQFVTVTFRPPGEDDRLSSALLWGQLGGAASVVVSVALIASGLDAFDLAGIPVRIGLYGPVLVLTALSVARVWRRSGPAFSLNDPQRELPRLVRLGAVAVGVCLLLMAPPLLGLAERWASGRLPHTEIFWRSSPRGVDLLAFLVPNPLHPWFGAVTSQWFMPPYEDAFPEFVGAFSLVALAVIALAARSGQLPRFWIWFSVVFASLALGPFVHLFGVNTHVPGPWALLRYVPVIGMARAPSRFAIVAVLGASVLFGFAVDILRQAHGRNWRPLVALVALLLLTELTPVPRRLFTAAVPDVYDLIATDDESRAVLELPTGVRDGTSSLGDFNASSQYFQTRHHRRLVGGYLSRVSTWRKREMMRSPTLGALVTLSEAGGALQPYQLSNARDGRDAFLTRSCVGYVVINRRKASAALRSAAVDMLKLVSVHSDADYELLRPQDPPPCEPRRSTGWARPGGARLSSWR